MGPEYRDGIGHAAEITRTVLLSAGQATLFAWTLTILAFLLFAVPGVWLVRNYFSWGKLLFPVGVVAALLLGVSKLAHGTRVLIVEVSPTGALVRSDRKLYGNSSYTMTNGSTQALDWNSARQFLLNDTPAALTVEKGQYGVLFTDRWEKHVAPFEMATFDGSIDHFGPHDPLPATSEKWERYWVRW